MFPASGKLKPGLTQGATLSQFGPRIILDLGKPPSGANLSGSQRRAGRPLPQTLLALKPARGPGHQQGEAPEAMILSNILNLDRLMMYGCNHKFEVCQESC